MPPIAKLPFNQQQQHEVMPSPHQRKRNTLLPRSIFVCHFHAYSLFLYFLYSISSFHIYVFFLGTQLLLITFYFGFFTYEHKPFLPPAPALLMRNCEDLPLDSLMLNLAVYERILSLTVCVCVCLVRCYVC